MRRFLQLMCWLLPPVSWKNAVLRKFGHKISDTARIGPIFVFDVDRFEIGDDVRVSPFTVFRGLSLVRLGDVVAVRSWNTISAVPEFQRIDPQAGTLQVDYGATIGARNYLDCSGSIIIGEFANVGGQRVFLQSQEIDLESGRQTAGRILIGPRAVVSSCSLLLKGADLPEQSLLAANSTMMAESAIERRSGLYAGAPATWKTETHGKSFVRTTQVMTDHVIDGVMGPEI